MITLQSIVSLKYLTSLGLIYGTITLSTLNTVAENSPSKTPKSLGYKFPDEWDKHKATMMIFPAKHHYGKKTLALRKEFAAIAKEIAQNEPVHVFCLTEERQQCHKLLAQIKNLTVHPGNYSIDWARDNAPMILRKSNGDLAVAGFQFNGWGKKYPQWHEDIETRNNIAKAMGWKIFHSNLVLEGGSIEIGGDIGIVTESCVLHPNRTNWPKHKVEQELKQMLGLNKIIWIKSGLMPDNITDGHVDGLLKFIRKDTVLLHTTDLKSDLNYNICQDAKRTLLSHGLKVVELPLMEDIVHMNFYIGSGGNTAYVPVCGDSKQDDPALKIIGKFFKRVIPIISTQVAKAGGGIHCYTQQIPQ